MKAINHLKLTDDEEKYLSKYEKMVERIYMNYITVGILFCIAIFGLVVGLVLKRDEGFLITIILTGLGVTLLLVSRKYQKLSNIVSKMKRYIRELEKQERSN